MINSRLKAFACHLAISILLLVCLLIIVVYAWYPNPFLSIGATAGLQLIIGVDLVLGPLLTLLVFDRTKKNLKIDLLIIALIQVFCFLAGTWLLYNQRPVAQVLTEREIYIVTASDVNYFKLTLDNSKSSIKPSAYLMGLPDDWSQLSALKLTSEFVEGKPFALRSDLYTSFSEVSKQEFDERLEKIAHHLVDKGYETPIKEDNCEWVPLTSTHTTGSACINHSHGIIKLSHYKSLFDLIK